MNLKKKKTSTEEKMKMNALFFQIWMQKVFLKHEKQYLITNEIFGFKLKSKSKCQKERKIPSFFFKWQAYFEMLFFF